MPAPKPDTLQNTSILDDIEGVRRALQKSPVAAQGAAQPEKAPAPTAQVAPSEGVKSAPVAPAPVARDAKLQGMGDKDRDDTTSAPKAPGLLGSVYGGSDTENSAGFGPLGIAQSAIAGAAEKLLDPGHIKREEIAQKDRVAKEFREDSKKDVVQLQAGLMKDTGAASVKVPIVDLGDKYGIDIHTVTRQVANADIQKQAKSAGYGSFEQMPDGPEKEAMADKAYETARGKVKARLFTGRRLAAISVDDDKTVEDLADKSLAWKVLDPTGTMYDTVVASTPKSYTIETPTASEMRKEAGGDFVSRFIFDAFNTVVTTRLENLDSSVDKMTTVMTEGTATDVLSTYVDLMAKGVGVGLTQDEKEDHVRRLRSGARMQGFGADQTEETMRMLAGRPLTDEERKRARVLGSINGFIAGDIALASPADVLIGTLGTGASATRKALKMRRIGTTYDDIIRLAGDPSTTPEGLLAAIKKTDPSMAEYLTTVLAAELRTDNSISSGAAVLRNQVERATELAAATKATAAEAEVGRDAALAAVTGKAAKAEADAAALADDVKKTQRDLAGAARTTYQQKVRVAKMQSEVYDAKTALDKTVQDIDDFVKGESDIQKKINDYFTARTQYETELASANARLKEIETRKAEYVPIHERMEKLTAAEETWKAATREYDDAKALVARAKAELLALPKKSRLRGPAAIKLASAESSLVATTKTYQDARKAITEVRTSLKGVDKSAVKVWREWTAALDDVDKYTEALATVNRVARAQLGGTPGSVFSATKLAKARLIKANQQALAELKSVAKKYGGEAVAQRAYEDALETIKREVASKRTKLTKAEEAARKAKDAEINEKIAVDADIAKKRLKADIAPMEVELAKARVDSWRDAARSVAEKYKEGARITPRLEADNAALARSTKAILSPAATRGSNPDIIADLTRTVGSPEALAYLGAQNTPLGRLVKRAMDNPTGASGLTDAEVAALQTGVFEYNRARVLGTHGAESAATFASVELLRAVEYTRNEGSILKRTVNMVRRAVRSMGGDFAMTANLGSLSDAMPMMARRIRNSMDQASDELAYLRANARVQDLSDNAQHWVKQFEVDPKTDPEAAATIGAFIDYLDTKTPMPYLSGKTLFNTSGTGTRWEDFRSQVLNDGRLNEFLQKATGKSADEIDELASKFTDTAAPHIVGISRVWFPSTTQKISAAFDSQFLAATIESLRANQDNGGTFAEFMLDLRERTRRAVPVGVEKVDTKKVIDGIELDEDLTMVLPESKGNTKVVRNRRMKNAGVGSADTNKIRVFGFASKLVSQGAAIKDLETSIVSAMAGSFSAKQIEHVNAFMLGEFTGVGPNKDKLDVGLVADFYNRMGLPLNSDITKIVTDDVKLGERVISLVKLGETDAPVWVTKQLTDVVDAQLGKVSKQLEAKTRTEGANPVSSFIGGAVALWRRSITTGVVLPKPAFFLTNYLGNITQAWTNEGLGTAAKGAIEDAPAHIPIFGSAIQDWGSRMAKAHGDKPVLGNVLDLVFNRDIDAVMNARPGAMKLANGSKLPYEVARKWMYEDGILDVMLHDDFEEMFAKYEAPMWKKVLTASTPYHASIAQFSVLTQQRSRAGLYTRLLREGVPREEASRRVLGAYYDWKHGAPAMGAYMQLFPFWRFTFLSHAQTLSAMTDAMNMTPEKLGRILKGDSPLGRIKQQRAAVRGVEQALLPDEDEGTDKSGSAKYQDPSYQVDRVRLGVWRNADDVTRQIYLDQGKEKHYSSLSIVGPTNLEPAYMWLHIISAGLAQAHFATPDGVVPTGDATKESVEMVTDNMFGTYSDLMRTVLARVGLADAPHDGTSRGTNADRAVVARKIASMLGYNPDEVAWQSDPHTSKWTMDSGWYTFTELPVLNEFISHFSRSALSPYRQSIRNPDRAERFLAHLIGQHFGISTTAFEPEDRQREMQIERKKAVEALVPERMQRGNAPFPGYQEDPKE